MRAFSGVVAAALLSAVAGCRSLWPTVPPPVATVLAPAHEGESGTVDAAVHLESAPAPATAPARPSHDARHQPDARGPVVCIDPGHPSETSGGAAANGVVERQVNQAVADSLQGLLEARGFRVVLTKHGVDERVTNRRRAEIANECGAAVFLRLHCDASHAPGFTLYYPDRAVALGGVTGPSAGLRAASRRIAEELHAALASRLTRLRDRGVLGESRTAVGARQGALTGSVHSRVPVVLIEMADLESPSDAKLIGSAEGRSYVASALANALCEVLRPSGS